MIPLFHLSSDPYLTKLTPKVPGNADGNYEDTVTERICFSSSITGCLNALECWCSINNFIQVDRSSKVNDDYVKGITTYCHTTEYNRKLDIIASTFYKSGDDLDRENLSDYILEKNSSNLHIKYPYFYVYMPKFPITYEISDVYDKYCTDEVWVKEEIDVVRIGGIIVTGISNIGPSVKVNANGNDIYIQPHAYEFIKMSPNWVSIVDLYKKNLKDNK